MCGAQIGFLCFGSKPLMQNCIMSLYGIRRNNSDPLGLLQGTFTKTEYRLSTQRKLWNFHHIRSLSSIVCHIMHDIAGCIGKKITNILYMGKVHLWVFRILFYMKLYQQQKMAN